MLKRIAIISLISFACGLHAMNVSKQYQNTIPQLIKENDGLVLTINNVIKNNLAFSDILRDTLCSQVKKTQFFLQYYPEHPEINASFRSLQNVTDKILPQLKSNLLAGIQAAKEKLAIGQLDTTSEPNRINDYKNQALEELNKLNTTTVQLDPSEHKMQKLDGIDFMKQSINLHVNNANLRLAVLQHNIQQASDQLGALEKDLQELK